MSAVSLGYVSYPGNRQWTFQAFLLYSTNSKISIFHQHFCGNSTPVLPEPHSNHSLKVRMLPTIFFLLNCSSFKGIPCVGLKAHIKGNKTNAVALQWSILELIGKLFGFLSEREICLYSMCKIEHFSRVILILCPGINRFLLICVYLHCVN